jgi:histidyl-tRNA synthetase
LNPSIVKPNNNNGIKTGIPKGTRDFSPTEVAKRQYIIKIIKIILRSLVFNP